MAINQWRIAIIFFWGLILASSCSVNHQPLTSEDFRVDAKKGKKDKTAEAPPAEEPAGPLAESAEPPAEGMPAAPQASGDVPPAAEPAAETPPSASPEESGEGMPTAEPAAPETPPSEEVAPVEGVPAMPEGGGESPPAEAPPPEPGQAEQGGGESVSEPKPDDIVKIAPHQQFCSFSDECRAIVVRGCCSGSVEVAVNASEEVALKDPQRMECRIHFKTLPPEEVKKCTSVSRMPTVSPYHPAVCVNGKCELQGKINQPQM